MELPVFEAAARRWGNRLVKGLRLLRCLRLAPRPGGLSVVMLVAYDWKLGIESLRRFYAIADEIVVGLDAERISFSGEPFPFNAAAFRRALKKADPEGKVRVVEGDFHSQGDPSKNETHERNVLSRACRAGHWVLQIDADEWMVNPQEFRRWLGGLRVEREIMARWHTVYKVCGRQALVVDSDREWICVGGGRRGGHWQRRETGSWRVRSPLRLLHFSFALTEAELRRKLGNWAHAREIDLEATVGRWRSATVANHGSFRDFHHLERGLWPRLKAVPLDGLEAWAGVDVAARGGR
jgi:hypothetical protein